MNETPASSDTLPPIVEAERPSALVYAGGWALIGLLALAAWAGHIFLLSIPVVFFGAPALFDRLAPLNRTNPPLPKSPREENNRAYDLVISLWPFAQLSMLGACLWLACRTDYLHWIESIFLFVSAGTITGAIGIVHAHELMHRQGRWPRFLADWLMAMTFYSHFRSEHLHVHHTWVGTPRDAVTARYNENIYMFFLRVVPQAFKSAWRVEIERLTRRGLPAWSFKNPFWLYAGLQLAMLVFAYAIGGWMGVALIAVQAFIAVMYLESTNYIEHYGLTRREIAPGRYEPVQFHHSWNSSHRYSNYLFINLPRHPDHHHRPDRNYSLLQTFNSDAAPQMPHSYPVMVAVAFVPPVWMDMMNARVLKWRARFHGDDQPHSAS